MEISRVQITDTRKISLDVKDVPVHYTPAGASPIAPFALDVEISVWQGRQYVSYEIRGNRLDGPKAGQTLVRRFYTSEASRKPPPQWAVELAEQHRPEWAKP